MRETVKPLFDRLVIKDLDRDEMRESGLLVPVDYTDEVLGPMRGIVLAAGPGLDWWAGAGVEMPVGVGDHVLFGPRAGVHVEINEEHLRILRVVELLGVVE